MVVSVNRIYSGTHHHCGRRRVGVGGGGGGGSALPGPVIHGNHGGCHTVVPGLRCGGGGPPQPHPMCAVRAPGVDRPTPRTSTRSLG